MDFFLWVKSKVVLLGEYLKYVGVLLFMSEGTIEQEIDRRISRSLLWCILTYGHEQTDRMRSYINVVISFPLQEAWTLP